MNVLNLLAIAALFIVPAAVIALVLYFVIRQAVLSALRAHSVEVGASAVRGLRP